MVFFSFMLIVLLGGGNLVHGESVRTGPKLTVNCLAKEKIGKHDYYLWQVINNDKTDVKIRVDDKVLCKKEDGTIQSFGSGAYRPVIESNNSITFYRRTLYGGLEVEWTRNPNQLEWGKNYKDGNMVYDPVLIDYDEDYIAFTKDKKRIYKFDITNLSKSEIKIWVKDKSMIATIINPILKNSFSKKSQYKVNLKKGERISIYRTWDNIAVAWNSHLKNNFSGAQISKIKVQRKGVQVYYDKKYAKVKSKKIAVQKWTIENNFDYQIRVNIGNGPWFKDDKLKEKATWSETRTILKPGEKVILYRTRFGKFPIEWNTHLKNNFSGSKKITIMMF